MPEIIISCEALASYEPRYVVNFMDIETPKFNLSFPIDVSTVLAKAAVEKAWEGHGYDANLGKFLSEHGVPVERMVFDRSGPHLLPEVTYMEVCRDNETGGMRYRWETKKSKKG